MLSNGYFKLDNLLESAEDEARLARCFIEGTGIHRIFDVFSYIQFHTVVTKQMSLGANTTMNPSTAPPLANQRTCARGAVLY
eukprot:763456-Hanusia_phi.AAC.4